MVINSNLKHTHLFFHTVVYLAVCTNDEIKYSMNGILESKNNVTFYTRCSSLKIYDWSIANLFTPFSDMQSLKTFSMIFKLNYKVYDDYQDE